MKKILLTAGAVLIALTSCSKDKNIEVNPGNAIGFRTTMSNPLRGAEVTTANIKDFNVMTYEGNTEYFSKKVTKEGDKWVYSPIKYWTTKTYDFYAYAPADAADLNTVKTNKQLTDFTPSTTLADQKDLVVAYKSASSGQVQLNFKHALSQIELKAKNDNATNLDVKILGFKIVNIVDKGTLTILKNETTPFSWANGTSKTTYSQFATNGTPVKLTADAQSIMFGENPNPMIIPQSVTKWEKNGVNGGTTNNPTGAYISVLIDVNDKNTPVTNLYPVTDGKYAYAMIPIEHNWEAGKKYIYTLNFFDQTDASNPGGCGQFDPDPKKPTPTSPVDAIDNTGTGNENGEKAGEPITAGKPISFTVEVTGWQDAGNTDVKM